ncbi:hypothetical protein [Streptomyces sp. NPDC007905]|uniref:hypothetical protein n=1 Tax=Streptomyces sp. NPDC007905 TaxID=3364788 RepID=UPI0036E353FA
MAVRRDLKRARQRTDLVVRGSLEIVRDATGAVREVRTAPLASPLTGGSLADLPFAHAAEAPHAALLRRRTEGTLRPVTAAAFAAEVAATARKLIAPALNNRAAGAP